jgi:hypothetical protein
MALPALPTHPFRLHPHLGGFLRLQLTRIMRRSTMVIQVQRVLFTTLPIDE